MSYKGGDVLVINLILKIKRKGEMNEKRNNNKI